MSIRSISQLLDDFKQQITHDRVSVDDILFTFHERGLGFVLILFSLPMALPLPVPPGINVLFASPLILLTSQQIIGRKTIWMPQKIRIKSIKSETILSLIDAAIPWTRRLEFFIRPRLGFMTQEITTRIIGILGLCMALTACIPLPLTNTVPSMGIALMSIGIVTRDGLAILAGALLGTLWMLLLAYIAFTFGPEGIALIKETIKSMM